MESRNNNKDQEHRRRKTINDLAINAVKTIKEGYALAKVISLKELNIEEKKVANESKSKAEVVNDSKLEVDEHSKKIISKTDVENRTDWVFSLEQIIYPTKVCLASITTIGQQKPSKDPHKKYPQTNKIAMSLLPGTGFDGAQAGRMRLFGNDRQYGNGLLFDIRKTDTRNDNDLLVKKLKEQNTLDEKPMTYSEVLVEMSEDSLLGIFFQSHTQGRDSSVHPKESLQGLLDTITQQSLVKKMLGVDLPILIINADTGVTIYTIGNQLADIELYEKLYGDDSTSKAAREALSDYSIDRKLPAPYQLFVMFHDLMSHIVKCHALIKNTRTAREDAIAAINMRTNYKELLKTLIDEMNQNDSNEEYRKIAKFFALMSNYYDDLFSEQCINVIKQKHQPLLNFVKKLHVESSDIDLFMRAYYDAFVLQRKSRVLVTDQSELDANDRKILIQKSKLLSERNIPLADLIFSQLYASANEKDLLHDAMCKSAEKLCPQGQVALAKDYFDHVMTIFVDKDKSVEDLLWYHFKGQHTSDSILKGLRQAIQSQNISAITFVRNLMQRFIDEVTKNPNDISKLLKAKAITKMIIKVCINDERISAWFASVQQGNVDEFAKSETIAAIKKYVDGEFLKERLPTCASLKRLLTQNKYDQNVDNILTDMERKTEFIRKTIFSGKTNEKFVRIADELRLLIQVNRTHGLNPQVLGNFINFYTLVIDQQLLRIHSKELLERINSLYRLLKPYNADESYIRQCLNYSAVGRSLIDNIKKPSQDIKEINRAKAEQSLLEIELNKEEVSLGNKIYKQKLQMIIDQIKAREFNLHGCRVTLTTTSGNKLVSRGAKTIYIMVNRFLIEQENNNLTRDKYEKFVKDIYKNIRHKTHITHGFFGFGARDRDTVNFYVDTLKILSGEEVRYSEKLKLKPIPRP